MNRFKTFTGGILDTNCYFLEAPRGNILFDAPQEADRHFAGQRVDLLVLTHGHFDHIADAAAIVRRHQCQLACHPETAPMIADPEFFRRWGFELEVDPVKPDFFLDEGGPADLLGAAFSIFLVPGHCPGSLCLYLPEAAALVGGDVLFRGGVGRWDLPMGDRDLLLQGIREKLLPLGDHVTVLPGHGPATTIGRERRENPFLAP